MKKQDRLVIIINDPCHNPTGYSLSRKEWSDVIEFLNVCSQTHSVVLLNDIAYIDYSYRQEKAKEYFEVFDQISDNIVVVIAFSLSKSMTSYGLRCGAALLLAKKKKRSIKLRRYLKRMPGRHGRISTMERWRCSSM